MDYAVCYIVWPDGTYVAKDDYVESDWTHKSDDYMAVWVDSNLSDDEVASLLRRVVNA